MPDRNAEGRPTVSVVVPTHFRNDRLHEALESVEAQTLAPEEVEVVVVDDSGERHAEPVAEEFDVPYVGFEENRGANVARTVGTEETTGRYIQFLDDDDVLKPEKLERQVDLLDRSPDVGVVYCGMEFEDGRLASPNPDVRGNVLDHALAFTLYPCQTTTMLTERSLVESICPMQDSPGADDLRWMVEFARRTEFDFVEEPLVDRGVIEDSRGKSMGVYHGRRKIIEEYDDLYAERAPTVRAKALASTHHFRAWKLLEDSTWSAGAIASYGRAAAHDPSAYSAGLLVASVLGRPGVEFGSRAYERIA
ncbi:glycosyltransferase family 2 protein [Halobium salinum]|uniref:Glycosyltransferase family 2 protein n=1 Tax=Halobium salinum TaxID=1364940 RepID=A0ABD5PDY3_9EURY|nr:glycosyltransferase family 2 protein [Halobium salinum]